MVIVCTISCNMFSGRLNHKLVMHSSEISFGVLSMKCSTFWNVSWTLRAENFNKLDDTKSSTSSYNVTNVHVSKSFIAKWNPEFRNLHMTSKTGSSFDLKRKKLFVFWITPFEISSNAIPPQNKLNFSHEDKFIDLSR